MCYVDSNGTLNPLYLIEINGIQTIITVPPKMGTPFRLIVAGSKFSTLGATFTIENPFNNFGSFQYEHIYYAGPRGPVNVYDFINQSNKLWDNFDTTNMPLHDNGSLINTAPQSGFVSGNSFPSGFTPIPVHVPSSESLDYVMKLIKIDRSDFMLKEPECKCKHLLDGHDSGCEYMKWKKSSKSAS